MQLDPERDGIRGRIFRIAIVSVCAVILLGAIFEAYAERDRQRLLSALEFYAQRQQETDAVDYDEAASQPDVENEDTSTRPQGHAIVDAPPIPPHLEARVLWGYPIAYLDAEGLPDIPPFNEGLELLSVYAYGTVTNPSDGSQTFRIYTGLMAYGDTRYAPIIGRDRPAFDTLFSKIDAGDPQGASIADQVPPGSLDPLKPLIYESYALSPHTTIAVLFQMPLLVESEYLAGCVDGMLVDPDKRPNAAQRNLWQRYRDGSMYPYAVLVLDGEGADEEWTPIEMHLP